MSEREIIRTAPLADPLGSPLARAVFEAATQGLLVLAPDGTVLALNQAFAALYAIDPDTYLGRPYLDFAAGVEVRRHDGAVGPESWVTPRALKGERVEPVLQTIRDPRRGHEFVARCSAQPLFEGDRFVSTTIVVEDATESTRAAQAVQAALSAAEVCTYRVDLLQERLWGDSNFARLYGISEDDAKGGPRERLYERVHPDDAERVMYAIGTATLTGEPHEVEYRIVLPDGSVRWILSRGRAEFDEAGAAIQRLGSIVDVTHRKEAEQALRDQTARYELVLDAETALNAAGRDYTALRQTAVEQARLLTGADAASLEIEGVAECVAGEKGKIGTVDESRGGGSMIRVPLRDDVRAFGALRVSSFRPNAFSAGQAQALELFGGLLSAAIGRVRTLEALHRNEADLERRVAERTEELIRANRDLDQFAYSVAHDLRAPLRNIVATSRLLLEDMADRLRPEEADLLRRQAGSGIRLAKIVDDLLGFARLAQTEPKRVEFDLTALVHATTEQVRANRCSSCEVEVREGMAAHGDPSLLGYVFVNLLDNALKFSPEGGRVTVGFEEGAFFVRDQGVGFEMAHAGKLFVAFERLVGQSQFEGTGVGLANVRRIVEKHGGRVWAESEPGRGSTFRFTLG